MCVPSRMGAGCWRMRAGDLYWRCSGGRANEDGGTCFRSRSVLELGGIRTVEGCYGVGVLRMVEPVPDVVFWIAGEGIRTVEGFWSRGIEDGRTCSRCRVFWIEGEGIRTVGGSGVGVLKMVELFPGVEDCSRVGRNLRTVEMFFSRLWCIGASGRREWKSILRK